MQRSKVKWCAHARGSNPFGIFKHICSPCVSLWVWNRWLHFVAPDSKTNRVFWQVAKFNECIFLMLNTLVQKKSPTTNTLANHMAYALQTAYVATAQPLASDKQSWLLHLRQTKLTMEQENIFGRCRAIGHCTTRKRPSGLTIISA